MVRCLVLAIILALTASPAAAQVFKPKGNSSKADKKADKKPAKKAAPASSGASKKKAAANPRKPARDESSVAKLDADYVKITDDDEIE
jgi:hypothetical protein